MCAVVCQSRGCLLTADALSPIDLIANVILVLGYLDDVINVPLGIVLAICLMPPALLAEHRQAARERYQQRSISWVGAALIPSIWSVVGAAILVWFAHQ